MGPTPISRRQHLAERREAAQAKRCLRKEQDAVFSVAPALMIAGLIIGAFLVVTVAALFIGDFFNATATAVDTFEDPTVTTGNDAADNIKENVFPIIIGLTALFGIGGLIIGAVAFSNRGG